MPRSRSCTSSQTCRRASPDPGPTILRCAPTRVACSRTLTAPITTPQRPYGRMSAPVLRRGRRMAEERRSGPSAWVIPAAIVIGLAVGVPSTALIMTDAFKAKDSASATAVPTQQVVATPARTPAPNFAVTDVLRLAQTQASSLYVFPQGANWIRCVSATYHGGNHIWSVTCEYYANKDDTTPVAGGTDSYTFDDVTGKLTR
jgi:hypothetical protein